MTQNLGKLPSNTGPSQSTPALFSDQLEDLLRCTRCDLPYKAAKSTSGLRLTYCSFLCELGDLGFSMAGLEHMQRDVKPKPVTQPEELTEPTPAE